VVAGELAIKRSLVRTALCSAASLGVYTLWWFFQYRRRMNAELGKSDDAGLHTAGLLVPFLNFYLLYLFWKDVSEARRRAGLTGFPVVPYVIGSIVAAPVFYALVNADLNEYWDRRTGGRATDAPFTTGEKVVTFLPLFLFGGLTVMLALIVVALA